MDARQNRTKKRHPCGGVGENWISCDLVCFFKFLHSKNRKIVVLFIFKIYSKPTLGRILNFFLKMKMPRFCSIMDLLRNWKVMGFAHSSSGRLVDEMLLFDLIFQSIRDNQLWPTTRRINVGERVLLTNIKKSLRNV